MRLPEGRNEATRQAVHGRAPWARTAELEYVSDRDGCFKRPLERCKLLTRWAFASCAKTRPFRNRPQISSLDALGIRAESRVFRAAGLTSGPWTGG